MAAAVPFWQDPGTAASTRLAEDFLAKYDGVKESDANASTGTQLSMTSPAFDVVRKRIADNLNTARVTDRPAQVAPNDVFLYPTGMATIYQFMWHKKNLS